MTKSKREKLRLEMVAHQDAARKLRQEIDNIDNLKNEKERKQILNKCFRLNSSENPKDRKAKSYSWHGYFRVEYFNENFEPCGTFIDIWDQFPAPHHMTAELNKSTWMDWIKNGKEISNKTFNKMLNVIKNNLIEK